MNAIEFQYRRIRQKYPNAPAIEIWHGVAIDFYLRQGAIPTEVLVRSALARAESYGVKYRPDQLRVPAGNPDGGQWTDEGGGGGRGANVRDRVARNRTPAGNKPAGSKPSGSTPPAENTPADATSPSQTYRDDFVPGDQQPIDGAEIIPAAGEGGNYGINLLDDEGKNGAHTIKKHVHKNDEALLSEAKREQMRLLRAYVAGRIGYGEIRLGSFPSVESANKLVNATLSDNRGLVELFLLGPNDRLTIQTYFSVPIGREAYAKQIWNSFQIRDAYGVRMVLLKDPTAAKGYRVHTSYPIR